MTDKLKSFLDDSGVNHIVNRNTYAGASGWPFVGLVALFVASYCALAIMDVKIPFELGVLAGAALGNIRARTYRKQ